MTNVSDVKWKSTSRYINQIGDDFQSPSLLKALGNDFQQLGEYVDFSAPFLFYSKRKRTKVYAENLVWDKEKNQYAPSGPMIVIPKDYTGWFDVVKKNEESPKHHSTIGSVAETGSKTFLTCSTIAGFRCAEEEDELRITSEIRVYPGEVLRVLGNVTKTWRVKDGENTAARPSTNFLKCIDRKKRHLYLPFAHPGKFCVLSENKADKNVVHQISGLLEFQLPILVRLVFGWPPPKFSQFSGFMRLVGMNRPDTAVLHNVNPDDKFVVLEVPYDINIKWVEAENFEDVMERGIWKNIIEQCTTRVYPFLITMKCLDIRYTRRPKPDPESGEQTEKSGNEKADDTPAKMGRMTRPLDMFAFNASDVFPRPLDAEEKKIADTWSISFTESSIAAELPEPDEDTLFLQVDDNEDEDEEEDEFGDIPPGVMMRNKAGKKKRSSANTESMAGYMGQMALQESIPMPRREYTGTVRETRERQMYAREANC